MDGDPTVEQIRQEYPRWHLWQGIAGLWYARRLKTSPPPVVRGEDLMDLRDEIRGWEGRHSR